MRFSNFVLLFVGILLIGKLVVFIWNVHNEIDNRFYVYVCKYGMWLNAWYPFIGLVNSECKSPSSFGSFNGKPAANISK